MSFIISQRLRDLLLRSKGTDRVKKEYVAAFRNNLRGTLDTIKIKNPDGSIIDVKKRHDEKMKTMKTKVI